MPTTLGTLICCLPVDTQIVTAVPASTVLPTPGSTRVTAPEAMESEYSLSMVICVRPACFSCSITVSFGCPIRLSGILVMPDEMYSVMIVPLVCFEMGGRIRAYHLVFLRWRHCRPCARYPP